MHLSPSPFLLAACLSLCDAAVCQEPARPNHHLVFVDLEGAAAVQRLEELHLDLVSCHGLTAHTRRAEVIATDGDLATLAAAGLSFRVEIRNLEDHYARELAQFGPYPDALTPPLGQGAMGGHWTLAQCVAILDQFAADHPDICAPKVSIGTTVEGRDLWMVKISDNVGTSENETQVLFDALHHAREPVSMEATLVFMEFLLEGYGTDPEATYIVDNREIYFVPVVNPDGYEYNRQNDPNGGGLWRKNRTGGYGVDLNRNYASFWGLPGASSFRFAEDYRGSAPFSEPESAAMEAFTLQHSFALVCTVHTYTDVLLTPWGYQESWPANAADYTRLGAIATATTGISVGPASLELGYLASGTALDHHHTAHGSLTVSPELGRLSEGGFWPDPTRTLSIATRHTPMFGKLALLAGVPLADAQIVLQSNGLLGSNARMGMLGQPGALAVLAASAGTANLPVPGITGNLLLDPATLLFLPGLPFGSSGYLAFDFQIPPDAGLAGAVIHWQMLHVQGTQLTFGNRETLALH